MALDVDLLTRVMVRDDLRREAMEVHLERVKKSI